MGKNQERGNIDLHLMIAVIVIVLTGGVLLWRLSTAEDTDGGNASMITDSEITPIEVVLNENPDPEFVDVPDEEEGLEEEDDDDGSPFAGDDPVDEGFNIDRVRDFSDFEANNEFQTVEFSGASFQLPSDWTASEVSDDSGNWLNLQRSDGASITIIDFDATAPYVEGGLAYANCGYFTETPSVLYALCEEGAHDGLTNEVWAATSLTEEEAQSYPPFETGSMWREFIVYNEDGVYFQAVLRQNVDADSAADAFDYILATLEVTQ